MKFGILIKKKFLEILIFTKVIFKYIESVSNSMCLNLGVMPVEDQNNKKSSSCDLQEYIVIPLQSKTFTSSSLNLLY